MIRALQGLLMASTEAKAVQTQEKRITVRKGHRDYSVGPVLIGCHLLSWALMADIVEVRYTTVEHLTNKELRDSGFQGTLASVVLLLDELKVFYPDLKYDSPVTVVRWENPRGAAVLDLEGTGGIPLTGGRGAG